MNGGNVMIEGIPIAALGNGIGVVGLVLIIFWMLSTGRLVTRREIERVEKDRDEHKAEAGIKDQQIAEKDRQLAHMAELGRTVDSIMRAMDEARRGTREGSP